MRLESGNVELGGILSLAFSPDGRQLVVGGGGNTAFWTSAPKVWNDSERAAERLRPLLRSNADFQNRIRMLSENLRLHEALRKLDPKDARVQAALAATQANWHASQQRWADAVAAFDRLAAINPAQMEDWLRTPGLLRVATALLHQNRPDTAAVLLQGGAKRRIQDGLPAIQSVSGFGFIVAVEEGAVRIANVYPNTSASRNKLLPGDVFLKVNGLEARKEAASFATMLIGPVGTKLKFTVQRLGRTETEEIELEKTEYRVDPATGDLLAALLAAIELRLTEDPKNAGLFELRAELALQENDPVKQAADYSAAIDILAGQPDMAGSARLKRLYHRRGDACMQVSKWREAVDDYNRLITTETTDAGLLSNRARAQEPLGNWDAAASDWIRAANGSPDGVQRLAEFARRLADGGTDTNASSAHAQVSAWIEARFAKEPDNPTLAGAFAQILVDKPEAKTEVRWTALNPTEIKSAGGATLTLQDDRSILASGVNPDKDTYTVMSPAALKRITAFRLEVLPDDSLPFMGSGRANENGNFALSEWNVTLQTAKGKAPRPIRWNHAWSDHRVEAAVHYNKIATHIGLTIDGNPQTYWEVWPRSNIPRWAVFVPNEPLDADTGSMLSFVLDCQTTYVKHNLGRFRISVTADPVSFIRERNRYLVDQQADPWTRLATAYHVTGNHSALDTLLKHHPNAIAGLGDLFASTRDWKRAIDAYRQVLADRPNDTALLNKLVNACQAAGKTREAVPHLAALSAATPSDTLLPLRVAALQAWFGEEKGLAATRQRILASAANPTAAFTAERTAKVVCLAPPADSSEVEAALALARKAVELGRNDPYDAYYQLTLGMAEYRSGHFAQADAALSRASDAGKAVTHLVCASAFYRAMSLFRQGKPDEARPMAIEAVSKMRPLPKDYENPLIGANHDDLIVWLACKEVQTLIKFDVTAKSPLRELLPQPKVEQEKK